jgi:SRSO17 transposase
MLPVYSINKDVFSIPVFKLKIEDVEGFGKELKEFQGEFLDCFHRTEPGEHFSLYMDGRFSDLERKTIEPVAEHMEGGKVRSMQHFISDAVWNEPKMLIKYHLRVRDELGDRRGVLIFDEMGVLKAGHDSAGVARQYCGSVGKVDNCQVGVFAGYAAPKGYVLLDKRLFMPKLWFGPDYETRRIKDNVPEDLEFKTKPQLAAEMFSDIVREGIIPFKFVTSDTVYGDNPDFIRAVDSVPGVVYFTAVTGDTRCVLKQPLVETKTYRYKGQIRIRKRVVKWNGKPVRVDKLAHHISRGFWFRRTVSEGTKGPIVYEFTRREVILCQDNIPRQTVWLVVKRSLGDDPKYSYDISNAPHSTQLKTFVWLSGMRWPIEQCFEEGNGTVGLDQYEVRKYTGWNHHMLVCMLAHFFLWHLRVTLGKKITSHHAAAA